MEIKYRRIDFSNSNELNLIAQIDVTIPALFDNDFKTDEESVQKMFKAMEKFTVEDFCEVGVNYDGKIIAFHIIKKVPYFNRYAGSVYTLWVSPDYRKKGIATELKLRGEAWAKESGLDHIYTWVHVDNSKMLNLNKELGYEVSNFKMKKKV